MPAVFDGRLLRATRVYQGLSQAMLARKAGVTANAVSNAETKGTPSLRIAVALAEALGVDVNAFLVNDQEAEEPVPKLPKRGPKGSKAA